MIIVVILKTFFGNKQKNTGFPYFTNSVTTSQPFKINILGVGSIGWYNGLDIMLTRLHFIHINRKISYIQIHVCMLSIFMLLTPYALHTVQRCKTFHRNTYFNIILILCTFIIIFHIFLHNTLNILHMSFHTNCIHMDSPQVIEM